MARLADLTWRWTIPVVLALAAIGGSLALVVRGQNAIFLQDQWSNVGLFERYLDGALTFRDLFAAHNEHRILLSRLVFLADLLIDRGGNRVNIAVIALVQAAAFATFAGGIWRLRPSRHLAAMAMLAAGVLLASAVQWENFTWGFQHQFNSVYLLALLTCLATARAAVRPGSARLLLAIVFGCAATLTMANGALALPVAALTLALAHHRFRPTLVVAAAGVLLLGVYAAAYVPVPGHTAGSFVLAHPAGFLAYVAGFVGSWWAFAGFWPAAVMGALGIAALGLVLAGLVLRRIEPHPLVLGHAAFMAFVVASAAVTGFGRLGFGLGQALSSRYTTPSAFFWASFAVLGVFLLTRMPLGRWSAAVAGVAAVAVVSITSLVTARTAAYAVQERNREARTASAALLSGVRDAEALRPVLNDPAFVWSSAAVLRARGLSIFASPAPMGRTLAEAGVAERGACAGRVTEAASVAGVGERALRLRGSVATPPTAAPQVFVSDGVRIVGLGFTVPSRWPGSRTQDFVAFARAGDARELVLLVEASADGGFCRLAALAVDRRPALEATALPLPQAMRPLPLGAVALTGDWAVDGFDPRAPGARPAIAPLYGSHAGSDAHTGVLFFADVVLDGPFLHLPFVTGPSTAEQSIEVRAADGTVIGMARPPVMRAWGVLRIALPGARAGDSVGVRITDDGRGWGEWVGAAAPLASP